jgi:hypothetical protein
VPLAAQPARAVGAEVLARAGRAYVVTREKGVPDVTRVDLYDVAPGLPRRGSLSLPFAIGGLTVPRYDEGVNAVLITDTTLTLRPRPTRDAATHLTLVDVSNPDHPAVAASVAVPGARWAAVVTVEGTKLMVAHHADPENLSHADLGPDGRFSLTEIDAADPSAPVVGAASATPGLTLAVRGPLVYTASLAKAAACGTGTKSTLRVSRRQDDRRLTLLGSIELPGVYYNSRIFIQGEAAFATTDTEILAIDLRNPARPTLAGRAPLVGAWAPEATGPGLLLSRSAAYRYDASLIPRLERVFDGYWSRRVRVFPERGIAAVPRGKKGVEILPLQ